MKKLTDLLKSKKTWFFGLVAVLIAHRLIFMTRGFWIDEFQSFYVVSGTIQDVLIRSSARFHQSPLYYLMMWWWAKLFGISEFSLRFPSLLMALIGGYFVFKLAQNLFSQEVGYFSFLVYFSLEDSVASATSFRPYAFGIMAVAMSYYYLLKWMQEGNNRYYFLYFVSSSLVFHAQWVFIPFLSMQMALFGLFKEKQKNITWKKFYFTIAAVISTAFPFVGSFGDLWAERQNLSYLDRPTLNDLRSTFFGNVPWPLIGILSIAGALILLDLYLARRDETTGRSLFWTCCLSLYATPIFVFILPFHYLVSYGFHPKFVELRLRLPAIRKRIWMMVFLLPVGFFWIKNFPSLGQTMDTLTSQALISDNVFFPSFRMISLILVVIVLMSVFNIYKEELISLKTNILLIPTIWLVIPPVILFLISEFTSAQVFSGKYFSYWVVGWALLGGVGLYLLKNKVFKWVALIFFILFYLEVTPYYNRYYSDDWLSSINKANEINTDGHWPVLFCSGLIESCLPSWLENPRLRQILNAPLLYYPLRGEITSVPVKIRKPELKNFKENLIKKIVSRPGFYLVVGGTWNVERFSEWLQERLGNDYQLIQRYDFPLTSVFKVKVSAPAF